MANSIKEQIIKQLAAGTFVSGQTIANSLGISRAAVSKHIKTIIDMGLDVYCLTGKGYKLAKPLVLLNKNEIEGFCSEHDITTKIEVHSIIDSTNDFLKRRVPTQVSCGQVCVAEFQSAGRGRRGRQWVSPFGSHIYMSMYWPLMQGMSAAMGLNVVAALAIADAIKSLYDINVELKWPNDIYLNGVKLAGILIELEGQALEVAHCIIGIGVNVDMPIKAAENIDQDWTDLQSQVKEKINRNELVAKLMTSLQARLTIHNETGIETMLNDWHNKDCFLNCTVNLTTGAKEIQGIARGINSQGALLLDVDGKVQAIYGGEVSLRKL